MTIFLFLQKEDQGIKIYFNYFSITLEMKKEFELHRECFVFEVISLSANLRGLSCSAEIRA